MKYRFVFTAALLCMCCSAGIGESFQIELRSDCFQIWSSALKGSASNWRGYFKIGGPVLPDDVSSLDIQTAVEVSGITMGRLKPGAFDIFLHDPCRYPKRLPEAYRFKQYCPGSEPCNILGVHGFLADAFEFWSGTEDGERRFWGASFEFRPLKKWIVLQPFSVLTYPDPESVTDEWFAPGPRLVPAGLFHSGTAVRFRSSVFNADLLSAVSLSSRYTPGFIFRGPFNLRLGSLFLYGGISFKAGPYISPDGSVPKKSFDYRLGMEGETADFSGDVEISGNALSPGGENVPYLETEREYKASGCWKTGIISSSAGFIWTDYWDNRGEKGTDRIYRAGCTIKDFRFKFEITGTAIEHELELREGKCSARIEVKPEWFSLGFRTSLHSRFALSRTAMSCKLNLTVPLRRVMLKGTIESSRPVYVTGDWINKLITDIQGEVILTYSFPD